MNDENAAQVVCGTSPKGTWHPFIVFASFEPHGRGAYGINSRQHPQWRGRVRWLAVLTFLFCAAATLRAGAAPPPVEGPVISIIIDDLGNQDVDGRRAVMLPGPVACAILPHTPDAVKLADLAHREGKEVLLHLPMQSVEPLPLGPGALTLDMDRTDFVRTVRGDLASIPYVVGVNNHMGSLMTRHPGDMAWLMEVLRDYSGLFFVDSRTTKKTVAEQVAEQYGIPALRRNVFLDDVRNRAAIRRQFQRLLAIARRRGAAIAIGHPHPATLEVLEEELPKLRRYGVRLISLRTMLVRRNERLPTWRASLSQ